MGIKELYTMRFEKLWDTFEKALEDEYRDQ